MYIRHQKNLKIHNNLVFGNEDAGIFIHKCSSVCPNAASVYAGYTDINNNTIVGNGLWGLYNGNATHVKVKNNIMGYNNNYDIAMIQTAGHDIDYNIYYDSIRLRWGGTTHYSLSDFQSASGHDDNSMIQNPDFVKRSNLV